MVKLVKNIDISANRNAFVNLALPYLSLAQPGSAKEISLTDKLKVTIWDRWDIKLVNGFNTTFEEVINILKANYGLEPKDVFKGNKPIYMSATIAGKEKEKKTIMKSKVSELLKLTGKESYVDLTVTFTKPGEDKLLNGVPIVRLIP